jgi:transposase-like protein
MEDRRALVEMATPYTPACFKYKLELKTSAQYLFATSAGMAELKRLRLGGMSCTDIAKHLGVSRSGVFLAWSKMKDFPQ